jgi:hypothetical protein
VSRFDPGLELTQARRNGGELLLDLRHTTDIGLQQPTWSGHVSCSSRWIAQGGRQAPPARRPRGMWRVASSAPPSALQHSLGNLPVPELGVGQAPDDHHPVGRRSPQRQDLMAPGLRVELKHFDDRRAAQLEELRAIANERPRRNRAQQNGARPGPSNASFSALQCRRASRANQARGDADGAPGHRRVGARGPGRG